MPWSIITDTAPAVEPVSIEEARAQVSLAEDDATYDTELNIYIAAARRHVEQFTGLRLIDQVLTASAASFCELERLPVAPVSAIASVKYLDTNGAEQTLDTNVYEAAGLGSLKPEVRLKVGQTWPAIRCASDAVRVELTAGYGAASDDVEEDVKLAMLLMIADWFRNREDSTDTRLNELPRGAAALLANYRL